MQRTLQGWMEAYHACKTKLGPEHPHTIESLREPVHLYESWNKPDETAQWRAKLPSRGDAEE